MRPARCIEHYAFVGVGGRDGFDVQVVCNGDGLPVAVALPQLELAAEDLERIATVVAYRRLGNAGARSVCPVHGYTGNEFRCPACVAGAGEAA